MLQVAKKMIKEWNGYAFHSHGTVKCPCLGWRWIGEWYSSSLAIVSPKAFARASIWSPGFPTWSCKLKFTRRIVCRPFVQTPRTATCTCSFQGAGANFESAVCMPNRQPLGREPRRKVRNHQQPVRRIPAYCVQNLMNSSASIMQRPPSNHANPSIETIVKIWSSNSLLDDPEVLFQKVANVAFGVPNVHDGDSWYGRPISSSTGFCPCFHVTCSHRFSHALIPTMQNFVPRIPPADPAWSCNHASDHTLKTDIKFTYISIVDASGPSSKTNDWCHDGIEKFQFVSHGDISAQKNQFVGKEGSIRAWQMVINIPNCIVGTGCRQHTTHCSLLLLLWLLLSLLLLVVVVAVVQMLNDGG